MLKTLIFRKMRQFSFFLNVQATFRLCHTRVYSSLTSNSNSWHAVAKAVPKTYASQAQKLARSLEEQFNIGEDGTVITARNGVKSNVRAEDLMSFYVTKKKTKLTAANLTDILEEMKTLQVSPLHSHSKKIYEEARKISSTGIERINASSSTATAQADKAEEIIEPLKPTIAVAESLTEVVEEREKPKRLHYEEVSANDLTDLHQGTIQLSQAKELETTPPTRTNIGVEDELTELEVSKSEHSKPELGETSEKSIETGSSQAKVDVEKTLLETEDKESSDKSSAESEKTIKTESIQSKVDPSTTSTTTTAASTASTTTATSNNPEFEKVKPAGESKDPVILDSEPEEPVARTKSKSVDDNSNQSSPSSTAILSDRSEAETRDVPMYLLVGLCIALGIYLFKAREKHEPSAKEMRPLPPQKDVKDNSDDMKTNQTLPESEMKDDVPDLELVPSDSSPAQSMTNFELESLKVN